MIISGPSGAGKSTVLKELIEKCDLPLQMSVSATTRPPRPNETNGIDYHFVSQEDFNAKVNQGLFLETVEVFSQGHWYGTLRQPVVEAMEAGKWVILEIDVVGASKIVDAFPDAITIFLHPGTEAELERRLRGRKTESEEKILRRLEVARKELEMATIYKHLVVNDTVENAFNTICNLLKSYRGHSCTKN
ncbi:MAG TPA: guanylate kinase [Pirellulaceae bacterium]|nr:guanylate kinase [Pirellulaceae bacterium]